MAAKKVKVIVASWMKCMSSSFMYLRWHSGWRRRCSVSALYFLCCTQFRGTKGRCLLRKQLGEMISPFDYAIVPSRTKHPPIASDPNTGESLPICTCKKILWVVTCDNVPNRLVLVYEEQDWNLVWFRPWQWLDHLCNIKVIHIPLAINYHYILKFIPSGSSCTSWIL